MPYGTIKIDTITFTDGGVDKSVPVSGLVQNPTFTGNITATGTISGDIIKGGTTVSGVTVIATTGTFTSLTGTTTNGTTASFTTGTFTSLTGTTTTGTTATFASGVFTTQVSGVTVIATTGTFTSLTGTTTTMTSGVFASGTEPLPSISFVSDPNTGIYSPGADQLAVATNGTGKLIVLSNGNVGIGAPAPGSLLQVGTGALSSTNIAAFLGGSTTFENATTGNGPSITFNSDLDTGILNPSANTLGINTGGTRVVTISDTQRVGIGTDSPGSYSTYGNKLVVYGTGTNGPGITIATGAADTGSLYFADGTTGNEAFRGAVQYAHADDSMELHTSGTVKVKITSAGLVGIGTTAPGYSLDIVGDQRITNSAGSTLIVNRTSNPGSISWQHSGTETGQIAAVSGGGLNFYTGSTPTLKATLDNSGRLLVGTSTARTDYFNNGLTAMLQVEGTNYGGNVDRACVSIVNNNSVTVNEAPVLILGRSNGSTVNSKTLVSDGTRCGYISFQGADGSDLIDAASIAGEIDGTPGANDMPGRLVFSTTADGAASPTERMRIDKSGSHALYGIDQTLVLSTNQASSASLTLVYGRYGATAVNGGTDCIYIRSNGNIQNTNNSYGAISDAKLKENIVDANSQWSDIKALQVRKFNFKEGQTHTQIGLVAQEVELVSPGIVSEAPDRDAEGNDLGTVTKSVNYSVLYVKAVKALQEAMGRIETLEQRLTAAGID